MVNHYQTIKVYDEMVLMVLDGALYQLMCGEEMSTSQKPCTLHTQPTEPSAKELFILKILGKDWLLPDRPLKRQSIIRYFPEAASVAAIIADFEQYQKIKDGMN